MRLQKHFQAALPGCPSMIGWLGPGAAWSRLLWDAFIWAGDVHRAGVGCAASQPPDCCPSCGISRGFFTEIGKIIHFVHTSCASGCCLFSMCMERKYSKNLLSPTHCDAGKHPPALTYSESTFYKICMLVAPYAPLQTTYSRCASWCMTVPLCNSCFSVGLAHLLRSASPRNQVASTRPSLPLGSLCCGLACVAALPVVPAHSKVLHHLIS